MSESRKTENFLNGASSSLHCSFIGLKYEKITFFLLMCIALETSYPLKTRGIN